MTTVSRWDKPLQLTGKSPEEAPSFYTGGLVRLAPKTWFVSSATGCTAFDTAEGLVLVDAGTSTPIETGTMTEGLRRYTPRRNKEGDHG
jgi:hypothetical protein